MSNFLWKLRYARYMNRKSKCGWRFAWYCAGVAADEGLSADDADPEDTAYEEMTYWGD